MGIGPSTKETSLHHFRDPLLDVVSQDTDVDLMGIVIVGTPDDNVDKMLVGPRTAVWAEAMRADGVIISSDGWGNSDVDFTNTCEQLGTRGIAVTGLNFSGTVAQFVVVNDYLDGIIDINLKFCNLYDTEGYLVEKAMNEAGIPVLGIETDYTDSDAQQLRTRISAFIEMLNN